MQAGMDESQRERGTRQRRAGECLPATRVARAGTKEEFSMAVLLIALLVVLLLGGLGFALHVLWWLALIALVVWLLGFVFRVGSGSRRWYYW